MGNPFKEESRDLLSLDTNDITHPSAAELISHTMTEVEHVSWNPYIWMDWKAKCPHSTNQSRKPPSRLFPTGTTLCGRYNLKQNVLKDYCQLFSKLFIPCQSRECDLYDLFRHENHPFPAALSDGGKLHTCQKFQLACSSS